MFGVIRSASGIKISLYVSMASFSKRTAPVVATMTGSTTIAGPLCPRRNSATAETMAGVLSMPVLTPSGGISLYTASSWAVTISTGVFTTMETPVVFCAVSVQMQLMP